MPKPTSRKNEALDTLRYLTDKYEQVSPLVKRFSPIPLEFAPTADDIRHFATGLGSQVMGVDKEGNLRAPTLPTILDPTQNPLDENILPGMWYDTKAMPEDLSFGHGPAWSKEASEKSDQIRNQVRHSVGLPYEGRDAGDPTLRQTAYQALGTMVGQLPTGDLGMLGKAPAFLKYIPKIPRAILGSGLEWTMPTISPSIKNYLSGAGFATGFKGLADLATKYYDPAMEKVNEFIDATHKLPGPKTHFPGVPGMEDTGTEYQYTQNPWKLQKDIDAAGEEIRQARETQKEFDEMMQDRENQRIWEQADPSSIGEEELHEAQGGIVQGYSNKGKVTQDIVKIADQIEKSLTGKGGTKWRSLPVKPLTNWSDPNTRQRLPVITNPTQRDIEDFARRHEIDQLRFMTDMEGNTHAWDADRGIHRQVQEALGLPREHVYNEMSDTPIYPYDFTNKVIIDPATGEPYKQFDRIFNKYAPEGALRLFRGIRGSAIGEHPRGISESAIMGEPRQNATFMSNSPYVASTYANPDPDAFYNSIGAVSPYYVWPQRVHEMPVRNQSLNFFEFDDYASRLKPGDSLVARGVYDIGPLASWRLDPAKRYSYPSDIWAVGRDVKKKAGIGPEGYSNKGKVEGALTQMMKAINVSPHAKKNFSGYLIGDPHEELLYSMNEAINKGLITPAHKMVIQRQLAAGDEEALANSLLFLQSKLHPYEAKEPVLQAPPKTTAPQTPPLGQGTLTQEEWEQRLATPPKARGGRMRKAGASRQRRAHNSG